MNARLVILTIASITCLILTNCEKYNLDKQGVPKFVNHDFIDLKNIIRISKFRSSIGHDYSDRFESCRSMKHYYNLDSLDGQISNITSNVYSPVSGKITRVTKEWKGTQLWIESSYNQAFVFIIFHIDTYKDFKKPMEVTEGEILGTTSNTDIAVMVNTWKGNKYISYFEVMTDDLFNKYKQRGINIDDIIISKEARDANPLECNGEEFSDSYLCDDWVFLK